MSVRILPEELLSLHKYWAKLEIHLGKDIIAARGVWDNLIKKRYKTLQFCTYYFYANYTQNCTLFANGPNIA